MIDIQKKGALFVLVPLLILGLSVTACENTEDLVDPSPTTGMVVIDISPDDIDAPWELILPDGSTVSGSGDDALKNQMPGSYQLNFGEVPGYGSPAPRSQTLRPGDQLRLNGTYIARSVPTGSVDINSEPDELEAGWFLTVDGKLAAMGEGDSTLADVAVGQVQLIWNPVEDWAAPQPNPSVQPLVLDSLITFAGTYTPLDTQDLGWIAIRPFPEGIQAPWTLSGEDAAGGVGDDWLPGRPVGSYTLTWGEVAGYRTPRPSTGALAALDSLIFEATYELATGTITIDPTPNEIDAPWTLASSQGNTFNGSGDTTLRDLPVGQYTLAWGAVSDWLLPDLEEETIFLGVDEDRRITGTYEPAPPASGAIVIQASPAEAPWVLTGPGFSTSGTGSTSFATAAPGEYRITWGSLSGWETPDPAQRSRTLEADGTITFVGAYGTVGGPSFTSVTGTALDGGSITIRGSSFGGHALDISSGIGPNGWIEQNAAGTPVSNLSGAPGWRDGFAHSVPAFIDDTIVRAGSHAVNASIDRSADGDWQKPVALYKAESFDKIYASWYVYFEPTKAGSSVQWKQWYVSPVDNHSYCAAVNNKSVWSSPVSNPQPTQYNTALRCCLGCADFRTCWYDITPVPYYAPRYDDPWQYGHHNRAATEPLSLNAPAAGRWTRMELYLEASDVDAANGRLELYTSKDGSPRQHVDTWTGVRTHSSSCSSNPSNPSDPWRYFGLHGYFDDNGGAFADEEARLFYDDIYVQFGTKARVEIGDDPDYWNCSKLEVQVPTGWLDGEVVVEFNRGGSFSSGETAYLFIVNSNGSVNPGYPFTVGSNLQ